jgi:fibronectin type 3 domain-containing protein
MHIGYRLGSRAVVHLTLLLTALIQINAYAAPPTPTGLTATAHVQSVTLSWTASSGATSYNIYRGTTSGSEVLITTSTSTTYTNSNRTPGTTLYYKVSAVDSTGESALSAEVSATPQPIPAPTGVAVAPASTQITVSWSTESFATSYNVYRSTTSGGEGTTPFATNISTTSYPDTGLTNGTKYFYTVAAVDALGTSPQSSEVSAIAGAPAQVTGLTATAHVQSVTLSWTASSGATSYNIYRGTMSGGEALITTSTSTSYTNSNRAPGTTLYYEVSPVNANGEGPLSAEVSATPLPIPAPTGVAASPASTQITVSWSTESFATSYNLYRSTTSGGEGTTPYVTNISTTSYTNTGLTNGTAYFYTVAAVDALGTSPQSAEVSAIAGSPGQVTLTPMPQNVSLSIGGSAVCIILASTSGNTAALTLSQNGQPDITGLPTGVTAWMSPELLNIGPADSSAGYNQKSTLYLCASGSAVAGSYTLTVTGTYSGGTVSSTIVLTIH